MKKVIHFFRFLEHENVLPPIPAHRLIPDWYKKSELKKSDGGPGLRSCMPYFDAMASGWIIRLDQDLHVSIDEHGKKNFGWKEDTKVVVLRTLELGQHMAVPEGHVHEGVAVWLKVGYKTPRGWSLLVTHPFNRFDLPFTAVSGIMDADKWHTPGLIPVFFKKDFLGVVPKGTPIAQVLPIKRANWTSTWYLNIKAILKANKQSAENFDGNYKKNFWVKKRFK
jgi:hypothetical protein